jgi:eukaryotic-like serine/threonine-protein kinase
VHAVSRVQTPNFRGRGDIQHRHMRDHAATGSRARALEPQSEVAPQSRAENFTHSPGATALHTGAAPSGVRRRLLDRGVDQIGRYTLLAQIAGGGMGSVHVALMRGPADFSRLVAIKCIHTRWLDDPKLVARFKNEIQLSARVLHPNVVQTLDVVEAEGELFLVMDYVDGVTLASLLTDLHRQNEMLPISQAASIVTCVLRGLHAAHDARDEVGRPLHIVHRDVSPQNIMIGRNGHVQVLDFGVAKVLEHSQHTAAGTMLGRLAYMAPEQVLGASSSPCTDVFGAGVVLWECLVGQRLFYKAVGTEGETLFALLSNTIPRAGELRADLPPRLDAVLARALERNPEQRFQSADEFARALEAAAPLAPPSAIAGLVSRASGARISAREALVQRARQEAAAAAEAPVARNAALAREETALRTELVPALEVVPVAPRARQSRSAPARDERLWQWLLGVAVAVGSVWYGSRVWLGRSGPHAPAAGALAASALPAREAAPPIIEAPAAQRVVAVRSEPEGVAAASSVASEPRTLRARRLRSPRTAEPARAATRAAPDPCDPPTYVGTDGIRHFKESCL